MRCSRLQMNNIVQDVAILERFSGKDLKSSFFQWFHHGVIFCSDLLANSIVRALEPDFHPDSDLTPRKPELYPSRTEEVILQLQN